MSWNQKGRRKGSTEKLKTQGGSLAQGGEAKVGARCVCGSIILSIKSEGGTCMLASEVSIFVSWWFLYLCILNEHIMCDSVSSPCLGNYSSFTDMCTYSIQYNISRDLNNHKTGDFRKTDRVILDHAGQEHSMLGLTDFCFCLAETEEEKERG